MGSSGLGSLKTKSSCKGVGSVRRLDPDRRLELAALSAYANDLRAAAAPYFQN